jgi:hypothetical protein
MLDAAHHAIARHLLAHNQRVNVISIRHVGVTVLADVWYDHSITLTHARHLVLRTLDRGIPVRELQTWLLRQCAPWYTI